MRITLPSSTPAELAVPDGRPRRGVVLAPDIMGLRPLFDEMCARLAAEHGWAVCAPEPFPGREGLSLEERMGVMGELDDRRQLGDLVAAASALAEHTDVDRIGVLGFCMGGMYALKAAAVGRFDRAVSFYGMIRVPEGWQGRGQAEPLAAVAAGAIPVLALVGGRDAMTPTLDIDDLEAAGAEVVRYPEAEHGFVHDPSRPAHRPDDAIDAWRRAVAFMATTREELPA
jgi:carboxymethylenebutenolidase